MSFLDKHGLAGRYNFLYIPRAGRSRSNIGYSFVNFLTFDWAVACRDAIHGVPMDPIRSKKVCTVSPATVQGLDDLKQHFQKTVVGRMGRGPVFLDVDGKEAQEAQ